MTTSKRTLSRRAFHARTASLLLGAVGAQPGTGWAAEGEKPSDSVKGSIDFHVHLTQPWYGPERPVTVPTLLNWMDQHGTAQAVVLPLVSPEAFYYPVATEYVLKETAPHRDRLIPFCAIDPRTAGTHLSTRKKLVDLLTRYVEGGARGFGEHKARRPIDDALNLRLYEACAEVGLPVLFHLDNAANMDRPGLPGLDAVLRKFPDLPFVGHGKGWWASIAGNLAQADLHVGYPKGPVAPGGAIDVLMTRHTNLYGDLSSSGAHAILRDPEFGKAFLERRADRLVFGTDFYHLDQTFVHFDLFDRVPVAIEVRERISSGNARKLLKLGA